MSPPCSRFARIMHARLAQGVAGQCIKRAPYLELGGVGPEAYPTAFCDPPQRGPKGAKGAKGAKGGNTMSLMSLIVTLIVVGVLLWLLNTYLPMDGKIKRIFNAVVVIAVILWFLSAFGVLGRANAIQLPRVR